MEGVVGKHQRADSGADLVYFGVGKTALVQAAECGGLLLRGELSVDEGFQEVAPCVGAFADLDLAGLAEPLQILTLRSGDEQDFAREPPVRER